MSWYYKNGFPISQVFDKQKCFGNYWIILEKHYNVCNCSYCQIVKDNFGFFKGIGEHHWTTIFLKIKNCKYYLRWVK